MINLSITQSTEAILTLKEKGNITVDNYTWNLYNKDSNLTYTFSCDNHSASPYYDAFTISIGTPQFLTGSSITFSAPAGTYDYTIYQMTNQYDLNIGNALYIVEYGIVTINGTSSEAIVYTASNYDTIICVPEL